MKKSIPRQVEIGGRTIKVRQFAKVYDDEGNPCEAKYVAEELTIYLDRTMAVERKWQCLEHEMFHAWLDLIGVKIKLEAHMGTTPADDIEEDMAYKHTALVTAILTARGKK